MARLHIKAFPLAENPVLAQLIAYLQYMLGAAVDSSGRAILDTSWSAQLQQSENLWMLLEGAHVLTLMLFAGTILFVDLRLLGFAFRKSPVSQVADTILPYTVAGFVVMIVTGAALFFANPFEYYYNFVFRLKLLFLAAAAINIFVFHYRVQRNRSAWDGHARPPRDARASAAASLALWVGVMVAGRASAYDWFRCEHISGTLATVSQCTEHDRALARVEAELAP